MVYHNTEGANPHGEFVFGRRPKAACPRPKGNWSTLGARTPDCFRITLQRVPGEEGCPSKSPISQSPPGR
ncbi:hypothetical protein AK973_3170 [Pseudomonas brassicacearum]|nr:hypothetical protein AK973_3170 [Pseudomonas brassicacearum]